jgi:lipid-A-disaccharide synthase
MHGASLVEALRRARPAIEVYGIGGERLRRAGMHILVDTATVATMGFVEIFGTLGHLLGAYRRVRRFMAERRPDLVVLIDYPEFNLLLAKRAKALGLRVFYYISPQVWAWRSGRVRKIARRVDRIGVVFPFEEALYNECAEVGGNGRVAEFVGHPLLDLVRPSRSAAETRARYGLDADKPLLAVLPGSRRKEIRPLLPPALEAAHRLAREGWQAAIGLAHTLHRDDLAQAAAGKTIDFPVVEDDTYNLVHAADVVLVASGTATMETALLERPMVIMYKVSPLTYGIGRMLVQIDRIGMPNIVLGRAVFPELIQGEATADNMVAAVRHIAAHRAEFTEALRELRGKLGEPGAAERAARLALELMP